MPHFKRIFGLALTIVLLSLCACTPNGGADALPSYQWSEHHTDDYVIYKEKGQYYLELRGEALDGFLTKDIYHEVFYESMEFTSVKDMMDCFNDNTFSDYQRYDLPYNCIWYFQNYELATKPDLSNQQEVAAEEYAKNARIPLPNPDTIKECTYPENVGPCVVHWDNFTGYGGEYYSGYAENGWNGYGYHFTFGEDDDQWLFEIPRGAFQSALEEFMYQPARELLEEGKLVYDERADAYVYFPAIYERTNIKRTRYYLVEDGTKKIYVKEMLKAEVISGMDLEYDQRYEVFAFYDTPQGCFQIKAETGNMPTEEWLLQFSLKQAARSSD